MLEGNEDDSDTDGSVVRVSELATHNMIGLNNMRPKVDDFSVKKTMSRKNNHSASRNGYSPVDSPRTPPKVPSSKPVATFKQESERLLQLLSNRFTSPLFFAEDSPETTSKVSSPNMSKESEKLLRLISSHSAPLLASPQLRGTPLVDSDNESVLTVVLCLVNPIFQVFLTILIKLRDPFVCCFLSYLGSWEKSQEQLLQYA